MEKKLQSKKGFTLAELLIVVGIIAVLVSISVPVFSSQLSRAKQTTDLANIRSAYAEVAAAALLNPDKAASAEVVLQSEPADWDTSDTGTTIAGLSMKELSGLKPDENSKITITYDAGEKTVKIGTLPAKLSSLTSGSTG